LRITILGLVLYACTLIGIPILGARLLVLYIHRTSIGVLKGSLGHDRPLCIDLRQHLAAVEKLWFHCGVHTLCAVSQGVSAVSSRCLHNDQLNCRHDRAYRRDNTCIITVPRSVIFAWQSIMWLPRMSCRGAVYFASLTCHPCHPVRPSALGVSFTKYFCSTNGFDDSLTITQPHIIIHPSSLVD